MRKHKKISGALAFLSFFYTLGAVGAVEHDKLSLAAGTVSIFIGIVCFWFFSECALPGKRKSR